MKKIIMTTILSLILSACGVNPVQQEQHTVKEVEYVIKIPPKELMTLPQPVADIDVDASTQADVAYWLSSKENYTMKLQNDLIQIASFFIDEQRKLDAIATNKNSQAKDTAEAADKNQADLNAKKKIDLNIVPSR